jgi:ABC-type Na+ efflux pump permease subunit
MIGTVVHQELLLGSRRIPLHVLRWVYGGCLVVQVAFFLVQFVTTEQARNFARYQSLRMPGSSPDPFVPRSAPHCVGDRFAEAFVPQQFILLAIATPALVAGAITDEKRRGTLQHLLLTDFGTRPLLLGKLLGRVAQVALVALAGLPLFALLGGFGGVRPFTFLAFEVLSVLVVFALAAAAILASVWCRQTRDAVLAVYAVGVAAGLVVWKLGGILDEFNPLWVLDSADLVGADELGRRLALAATCWGTLGGVCLGLAVWRLNPAYLRELEAAPRKAAWYAARRAAVGDDPVLWRERHVEGLAPAAGLRRVPQWLVVTGLALATTASSLLILTLSLAPGASPADVFDALRHLDFVRLDSLLPGAADGFLVQGVVILLLASLVVGIRCSGAVTGERERQTWEPLLLTPLTARELIRGKLWGIMGASYVYLVACGLPAGVLSSLAGPLAFFWTILWLAVTVLAMYFVGATGLYSSVGSKSSWQSLLKTLFYGYLAASPVYFLGTLLWGIVLMVCVVVLSAVDIRLRTGLAQIFVNNLAKSANLTFFAISLGLAISYWILSRLFLSWAQTRIAQRERTRHWRSAPVYRHVRRRPPSLTR